MLFKQAASQRHFAPYSSDSCRMDQEYTGIEITDTVTRLTLYIRFGWREILQPEIQLETPNQDEK